MLRIWIALALCAPLAAAETWNVQVEEPTGVYRRHDEVISVPLSKFGKHRDSFRVVDEQGGERPWQAAASELLFPASVIPGELPIYRVTCCEKTAPFVNPIMLRRIGMRRVELGNNRFREMIDAGAPAIVQAYSLTPGP